MASILDRLVQLESEISYQELPPPGEPEFRYTPGSIPVLLSAPHGAVHMRQGERKPEDEFTAGLARLIAEMTGAHVLYTCRESGTDPNYYPDVPYKQELYQIIQTTRIGFVLDIHGAAADHEFGLALGTMEGKSCPDHRDLILETLAVAGFSKDRQRLSHLDVDNRFKAAGSLKRETVTRFVWQKAHTPAAQFELNAHLRIVQRKPDASIPELFQGIPNQIEHTVLAFFNLTMAITQALSL